MAERCPRCGRVTLESRWERKAWDEEACSPIRSPGCWRVTGKSKNGGPLLTLVSDGSSETEGGEDA